MQLYPVTNFWLAMVIREGLPGENRGIDYFKIEQSLPDFDIYEYINLCQGWTSYNGIAELSLKMNRVSLPSQY